VVHAVQSAKHRSAHNGSINGRDFQWSTQIVDALATAQPRANISGLVRDAGPARSAHLSKPKIQSLSTGSSWRTISFAKRILETPLGRSAIEAYCLGLCVDVVVTVGEESEGIAGWIRVIEFAMCPGGSIRVASPAIEFTVSVLKVGSEALLYPVLKRIARAARCCFRMHSHRSKRHSAPSTKVLETAA
jgi:hypothetical protein